MSPTETRVEEKAVLPIAAVHPNPYINLWYGLLHSLVVLQYLVCDDRAIGVGQLSEGSRA